MENFIYEYPTKVLLGKGIAKEQLSNALKPYGNKIMLAYDGGSIKNNGIYMKTYFGQSDEDNTSDDIAEAVMKNTIRNMRTLLTDINSYTARSNLIWDSAMAENGILKLGRKTAFQAHQIEHQLGAYTDCNHGQGLAIVHPVYYKYIYKDGLSKFARFAVNVWGVSPEGKSDEDLHLQVLTCLPIALRNALFRHV